MPRKTQLYGIDTSVYVRLLTGHPDADFKKTTQAIRTLLETEPSAEIVVSNQVIGEAYIALQHHYKVSKADARASMIQLFASGILNPLNGVAVIEVLKAKTGCGLLGRLNAQDYEQSNADVLTNDRKVSKLDNARLL